MRQVRSSILLFYSVKVNSRHISCCSVDPSYFLTYAIARVLLCHSDGYLSRTCISTASSLKQPIPSILHSQNLRSRSSYLRAYSSIHHNISLIDHHLSLKTHSPSLNTDLLQTSHTVSSSITLLSVSSISSLPHNDCQSAPLFGQDCNVCVPRLA